MEGAPPVANQIDLFMHFLGASCDGLVARRVDLDTISSSAMATRHGVCLLAMKYNIVLFVLKVMGSWLINIKVSSLRKVVRDSPSV